jgi:four helix bundle protein
MSKIEGFRDLIVFQKAYNLSMEIFKLSVVFPKEEKFSLTDQIRRSSRSISTNISEAWAKRRYEKSFINKLTDSLGEEFETETWIDYAKDCNYIDMDTHKKLISEYEQVKKILISMINNPSKWCPK